MAGSSSIVTRENRRVVVLSVEPSNESASIGPRIGDRFDSEWAVADALKAIGASDPACALDVILDSIPPYACRYHILSLRNADVLWTPGGVSWSVDENTLRYAPSDPAPEVPFHEGDFVPSAKLVALFNAAALEQRYWSHGDEYGDDFVLPYAYHDVETALDAFVQLSRQRHLVPSEFSVRVEIDRRMYGLWIEPNSVELQPLYAWVDDARLRALLRRSIPTPGVAVARRAGGRAVSLDASAPLTTGSVARRKAAALAFAIDAVSNGAVISYVARRRPEVVEALLAAARAEPNAGAAYEEFRAKLYDLAVDCSSTIDDRVTVILNAIPAESDFVRIKLYVMLSTFDDHRACRALVWGFTDERGDVRRRIGAVLWRQARTIEILIRDKLVPSWRQDEALCRAIFRLLSEEHVSVRRAWLAGADAKLLTKLGPLIED